MSQTTDLSGKTVLVTGASGFLGSRTVTILSERGCSVHALVRKTSRTDHLCLTNVTIFQGDIAEVESLRPAFEGVQHVIHAAADTRGNEDAGKLSTIQGTQNILALCEEYRVKKLIYISSCSVYGVFDYKQGKLITEDSSLERFPEKRGPYSHAKFRAEQLITRAIKNSAVPIVCLRPGTIYGPGGDVYSPMIGFALARKLFVVIGSSNFILPLVYLDNMVEAIIVAMNNHNSANKIYNVVDPEKVTKKDYMEGLVKKLFPTSFTIYVPFNILKILVSVQEKLFSTLKWQPILTTYRLVSSQNPIVYDSSKIRKDLNWKPLVTVESAFNNLIQYANSSY